MQKTRIDVPTGIKYMSQWENFELPQYPHILNKVVTGCGFTEYFLRPNPKYPKVILVSPRRVLLENKEEQHNNPTASSPEEYERLKGERGPIMYARSEFEFIRSFDSDLNKNAIKEATKAEAGIPPEVKLATELYKESVRKYEQRVRNYVEQCWSNNLDIRIGVTYDSFRLVKEALGDSIREYQIVVDEFQSIFTDSKFKSDTELGLLEQLRDLQNVCFLSATPMLDEYLDRLKDFKDLPYIELDWNSLQPGRVHRPNLDARQCTSIVTAAKEEIDRYLQGDFERYSYRDEEGNIQEIYSRELVIYCNSVKNICDILRKCNLRPEQVNILCAQTEDNRKKINQAFKVVDDKIPTRGKSYIGSVPQQGESHKMFTFCTRTVYLGADFYSTNARSLVLSDANIDCLAVDISLDLPQILGRQRLVDINPWANSAIFRFKTNTKKVTEEEYKAIIDEKSRKTDSLLSLYDKGTVTEKHDMATVCEFTAISKKYRDDYVAVNHHSGSDLKPCFNELVMIAEQRAFDIQKKDYADRFSVMAEVTEKMGIDSRNQQISEFLNTFESYGFGRDKMRFLCEFLRFNKDLEEEILMNVPLRYKNYYTVLTPSRCYAFSYQMDKLEKEYQKQLQNQGVSKLDLRKLIYDTFKEGERYTKAQLKEVVQKIYDSVGLKKTGKASDFEEWFELKECLIQNSETGKRDRGFQLIKKKITLQFFINVIKINISIILF